VHEKKKSMLKTKGHLLNNCSYCFLNVLLDDCLIFFWMSNNSLWVLIIFNPLNSLLYLLTTKIKLSSSNDLNFWSSLLRSIFIFFLKYNNLNCFTPKIRKYNNLNCFTPKILKYYNLNCFTPKIRKYYNLNCFTPKIRCRARDYPMKWNTISIFI
jgi:hypothetical protein